MFNRGRLAQGVSYLQITAGNRVVRRIDVQVKILLRDLIWINRSACYSCVFGISKLLPSS